MKEDLTVQNLYKCNKVQQKRIKELETENADLKEWRRRYDAGKAERQWKALGGSW